GTFGKDLFITYAGGDGNDVVLFTKGFTADFDQDLDVDGADFLIWQRNKGLSGMATNNQGDADGDKDVDAADLSLWQTQFGSVNTSLPASAPIPDPPAALLLLTAAVCGLSRHSNRRGIRIPPALSPWGGGIVGGSPENTRSLAHQPTHR